VGAAGAAACGAAGAASLSGALGVAGADFAGAARPGPVGVVVVLGLGVLEVPGHARVLPGGVAGAANGRGRRRGRRRPLLAGQKRTWVSAVARDSHRAWMGL